MEDNYIFFLVHKDQFDDVSSNCLKITKASTDGDWQICFELAQSECEWVDYDDNLVPQHMKDLGVTQACLSTDLANLVMKSEGF